MFPKETALLNDRVRGKQNLKVNVVLMCKYYIVFTYLLLDLLLWRLFLLVHLLRQLFSVRTLGLRGSVGLGLRSRSFLCRTGVLGDRDAERVFLSRHFRSKLNSSRPTIWSWE